MLLLVLALHVTEGPDGEEPSPTSIEYETYSKYGFSIECPKGMTITEEGLVDATANDNSGMVTAESLIHTKRSHLAG